MKNKKKAIYEPTDSEKFMNAKQIEYFKNLLLTWRKDILQESSNTLDHLKEESSNWPVSSRLLLGERGGKRLEGFDLGNSPVAAQAPRSNRTQPCASMNGKCKK